MAPQQHALWHIVTILIVTSKTVRVPTQSASMTIAATVAQNKTAASISMVSTHSSHSMHRVCYLQCSTLSTTLLQLQAIFHQPTQTHATIKSSLHHTRLMPTTVTRKLSTISDVKSSRKICRPSCQPNNSLSNQWSTRKTFSTSLVFAPTFQSVMTSFLPEITPRLITRRGKCLITPLPFWTAFIPANPTLNRTSKILMTSIYVQLKALTVITIDAELSITHLHTRIRHILHILDSLGQV